MTTKQCQADAVTVVGENVHDRLCSSMTSKYEVPGFSVVI